MRYPKPHTTKAKILGIMTRAKEAYGEVEFDESITGRSGKPISSNTLSMYMTQLKSQFFTCPTDRFYYRTDPGTGKRYVCCVNEAPRAAVQNNNADNNYSYSPDGPAPYPSGYFGGNSRY